MLVVHPNVVDSICIGNFSFPIDVFHFVEIAFQFHIVPFDDLRSIFVDDTVSISINIIIYGFVMTYDV